MLLLSEIVIKSDSRVKMKRINDDLIKMKIQPLKNGFPETLFDDLLNKMSDAFNVDIAYSIEYGSRHTTTQSIEV